MNLALATRNLRFSLAGIGLAGASALVAATLLLYVTDSESTQLLAVLLSGAIGLIGAFVSGNPRLYCLWGFMLTAPFDLSKRIGPIFRKMGGETSFRIELSDVFLLGLALFIAWEIWTGRRGGLRVPKVLYVWFLIMLLGCLAVVLGPWRYTAVHELVRMLKMTVLFLVISNELETPRRFLHCAAGLTLGVLVQATTGVVQYVTRKHFGLDALGETGAATLQQLASDSVRGERAFRAGAFLSHPNVFGIFLAALLPLVIGLFLGKVGKGRKVFFLLSATLGMGALIATLSRSGWVSFAAAFTLLMFLLILHRGLRPRSVLAGTVVIAALITVGVIFAGPISTRIFSSREIAMSGRAVYVGDAMRMIAAKPLLGFGLNSYVLAVPPYTRHGARQAFMFYESWIPPVHNIYLLWWSETGIIGLALFLWLVGGVIWIGVGNLRVKDELMFTMNAACLSAMLAFLVDGFFSFSLRFNQIQRVFWVQAGIMMAVHYWRLRHPAGAEP